MDNGKRKMGAPFFVAVVFGQPIRDWCWKEAVTEMEVTFCSENLSSFLSLWGLGTCGVRLMRSFRAPFYQSCSFRAFRFKNGCRENSKLMMIVHTSSNTRSVNCPSFSGYRVLCSFASHGCRNSVVLEINKSCLKLLPRRARSSGWSFNLVPRRAKFCLFRRCWEVSRRYVRSAIADVWTIGGNEMKFPYVVLLLSVSVVASGERYRINALEI